jgi:long-chain acyl-CoA synthetase
VNLADLLLGPAESAPASVALRRDDGETTYAELADRARRLAGGLVDDGVTPGERVAISSANREAFVVSYLGVLVAGAVAVPLNPVAPPAEQARELAEVEPRVVVCGPGGAEHVRAVVDESQLRSVGDRCEGFDRFEPAATVARAERDVAALLFTSGTAGSPKAAMLTHGNLAANIHQVLGHPGLRFHATDVVLAALPFFHVYGLNVVLGTSLAAGASLVPLDGFDAAASLDLIRAQRVTVLAGVPTMFAAWLELDDASAPADGFETVRLAVSGAAPLRPDVCEAMQNRFGLAVHEGYGLTEASPIVTTSAAGAPRVGSIGPPLPGVDVRLVDVDGDDVPAGDPGEIWARGPNVFPGYWRDEHATKRVLTADGWLRTGDVAVADDDGYLSLVDRAKDLVIVSGFNVYPAEVEDVLRDHPDVADAAVVGRPSPRTGETLTAYVVAAGGRTPDPDDLRAFTAGRLARYKCPSRVEVVDELPRTLVGKVLRRELRDEPT